jgi:hypothetical protein
MTLGVVAFNNLDGARPRLSVRRARDPPKNSEGQIFCDHPERSCLSMCLLGFG